jgi:hypothetical protein
MESRLQPARLTIFERQENLLRPNTLEHSHPLKPGLHSQTVSITFFGVKWVASEVRV